MGFQINALKIRLKVGERSEISNKLREEIERTVNATLKLNLAY